MKIDITGRSTTERIGGWIRVNGMRYPFLVLRQGGIEDNTVLWELGAPKVDNLPEIEKFVIETVLEELQKPV